MPKIQMREIDDYSQLIKDPAITNWTICKDKKEEEIAIAIYEQFAIRRHDLQIYHVKSKKDESVLCLLIKRSKLNEDKYFYNVKQYTLREGISIDDVLQCVLNYVITFNKDAFDTAVEILKRSIQYTPHPSRTEVIQFLMKENPELYVAVLVQDGINNDIIENEENNEEKSI